jgi:phosphatidyl-myo-inositol dimannoside synthase
MNSMKICIICFEFKNENIYRQPWHYIYKLSTIFINRGIDLFLISDNVDSGINNIKIYNVKKLYSLSGESNEVLNIISAENPDIIIRVIGITSFLIFRSRISKPSIGLLSSPIYSLSDILNIDHCEYYKHFNYIFIHLIGAILYASSIRPGTRFFKNIVVLSKYNQNKLIQSKLSNISLVRPGFDKAYLELPERDRIRKLGKEINAGKKKIIMYFTSPLTLRGTDTLIKAFSLVNKAYPCKLVFLSRIEHKELLQEEQYLRDLASKENISDSVIFISKSLAIHQVKEYLALSDIICLPFKIIISDVPISMLEAMALGKPIVATNIGCSAELIDGRGIIVSPGDPISLAKALISLLRDDRLAMKLGNNGRSYMQAYPSWEDTADRFLELIEKVLCDEK